MTSRRRQERGPDAATASAAGDRDRAAAGRSLRTGRSGLRSRVVRVGAIVLIAAACAAFAAWAVYAPAGVPWGVASFVWVAGAVLLGLVLYGSRLVPAQELAVVAALAALASASRVLFAAIPNFKPVTFVVLVSGVGLGPGPGFMIGVTSALLSNFFFGQGPWTPWQMLGWGLVGLIGGLMGRNGRVPRRWTLVAVGTGLAVAFDWLVSAYMYIAFTAHTWQALIALYAQGLAFDLSHAAATALFCGLFGVQACTIIARYHRRTEVTLLDPAPAVTRTAPKDATAGHPAG